MTSQEGLKMDMEKVNAIVEWSTPKSGFDVRRFHGLEIFYNKFIKKLWNVCTTNRMYEEEKLPMDSSNSKEL